MGIFILYLFHLIKITGENKVGPELKGRIGYLINHIYCTTLPKGY